MPYLSQNRLSTPPTDFAGVLLAAFLNVIYFIYVAVCDGGNVDFKMKKICPTPAAGIDRHTPAVTPICQSFVSGPVILQL